MNTKGFTLIELLVVVLIIGILSSVALPQYTKAVNKARMTEVWSTLKSIEDALAIYSLETGTTNATVLFEDLSISFKDKNGNTATGQSFNGKNGWHYEIAPYSARTAAQAVQTENGYFFVWIINGKKHCLGPADKCRDVAGIYKTGTSCLSSGTGQCYAE